MVLFPVAPEATRQAWVNCKLRSHYLLHIGALPNHSRWRRRRNARMRKDTSSSSLMPTMMDEIFPVVATNTQDTKAPLPPSLNWRRVFLMCKQGETSHSKGLISVWTRQAWVNCKLRSHYLLHIGALPNHSRWRRRRNTRIRK